jgi:hypothetical protein
VAAAGSVAPPAWPPAGAGVEDTPGMAAGSVEVVLCPAEVSVPPVELGESSFFFFAQPESGSNRIARLNTIKSLMGLFLP